MSIVVVLIGRVVIGRVRAVDDGRGLGVGVGSHGFDFVGHDCLGVYSMCCGASEVK